MPGEDFILDRSRIKYVDPTNLKFEREGNPKVSNSITRINNPYEEFNMVVDLEVIYPNRFGCGLALDGYQNEDKYLFSSENGTLSFFGGKEVGDKKYLSTDYTDINLVNPTGNTSECLGIESIHIEYDSWIYPKVHIKFVDVRGAALMSNMEYANENNDDNKGVKRLYRSLFMMPYPIFRLRVKGYYGKSVTYYLTVSNDVQITMDANTGDYILDVDFVGSMFRIFADLPMTFISVAPYLTNGKAYWEENAKTPEDGGRFYFVNRNGSSVPMITLPEFVEKCSTISSSSKVKNIMASKEVFLENANEQMEALKTIKSLCPYYRYVKNPGVMPVLDEQGTLVVYDEAFGVTKYGVLFVGNKGDLKTEEETFNIRRIKRFIESVEEYTKTFQSNDSATISGLCSDLVKYEQGVVPGYMKFVKNNENKYILEDSGYVGVGTSDDNFTLSEQYKNKDITYIDLISAKPEIGINQKDNKLGWAVTNAQSEDLNEFYLLFYELPNAVDLLIALETSESDIAETTKSVKKEFERKRVEIIEEVLGFSPTIRNIYNMVFAHMDTFIYCMRECTKGISLDTQKRKIKDPDMYSDCYYDVDPKYHDFLPPFAGLYKDNYTNDVLNTKDSVVRRENVWLDEISNGCEMAERNFVLDLLSATKLYASKMENAINNASDANNGELDKKDISKFIPLTTYDWLHNIGAESNPYSVLKNHMTDSDEELAGQIMFVFALRSFMFNSYMKFIDDWKTDKGNARAFGRLEALNFFKGVGLQSTSSFIKFINKYADGKDYDEDKDGFIKIITDGNSEEAKAWGSKGLFATHKITSNLEWLIEKNIDKNDQLMFDYPFDKSVEGKKYTEMFPLYPNGYVQFKDDMTNESFDVAPSDQNELKYIPTGGYMETPTNFPFETFFIKKNPVSIWNDVTRQLTEAFVDNPDMGGDLENAKATINKVKGGFIQDYLKERLLDVVGFNHYEVYANNTKGNFEPYDNVLYPSKESDKDNLHNSRSEIVEQINNLVGQEQYKINNLYVKKFCFINDKEHCLFGDEIYNSQKSLEAKAYLFLWSINATIPGDNDEKQRDINGVDSKTFLAAKNFNGSVSMLSLLREGSLYWRRDVMGPKGENPDPIYHGKYRQASVNEVYMTTNNGFLSFAKENEKYRQWYPGCNQKIPGCTSSRRRRLVKLFKDFANGTMEITISNTKFEEFNSLVTNNTYYNQNNFDYGFNILMANGKDIRNEPSNAKRIQDFIINEVVFNVVGTFDYYNGLYYPDGQGVEAFFCDKGVMKSSFKGFMQQLKILYGEYLTGSTTDIVSAEALEKANDPYNNTDIRIATYLTLKNLYDKWLCQPLTDDQWELNVKKQVSSANFEDDEYGNSEFDSFMYIDTFYHDIGYDILADATGIVRWLSGCMPTENMESDDGMLHYMGHSIYEFLVDVAANCGGMFLALPQMLGNKNATTMAEMFKAVPYYEYEKNRKKNDRSTFVFLYTYKPSEHLGNDDFTDDGIDLESDELTSLSDNGYPVPAFAVSYGKQNQSYFKNITLNTNQSLTTEASIAATMAIASKGAEGPRESNIYGQDLYRVKVAYSYECDFDMMGDVQIMPLMMFQLKNVPFWKGAYQIYNVSHDIQAGDITTHVKGMRINKYSLPLSDGFIITTDNDEGGNGVTFSYLPGEIGYSNDAVFDLQESKFKLDVANVDIHNVTEEKPLICLTPAHGPNTTKGAEWLWSHYMCNTIKKILSTYKFYDGTSYADNVIITNKNGANTSPTKIRGGFYSMPEVRDLIRRKDLGSKKVISIVPHWNGDCSNRFESYYEHVNHPRIEYVTSASKKLADFFTEEAKTVTAKCQTYKEMPVGMMDGGVWESNKLSNKDSDPAVMMECAAVLTENWFANYPRSQKSRYTSSRVEFASGNGCWSEKDENGRYFIGEGWLASEEGMTVIANMHAKAIKKYIDSLHS